MILFQLFTTFFKIGLFTFGGGYAMIPLIQAEVTAYGWLSVPEVVDLVAISQLTPGPIAVNSATFTGMKMAGFLGAVVATFGVVLPAFIIALAVAAFFFGIHKHPITQSIMSGVRPAVLGLIAFAAFSITSAELFPVGYDLMRIDWRSAVVFACSLILLFCFKKLSPAILILLSAVAGIFLF